MMKLFRVPTILLVLVLMFAGCNQTDKATPLPDLQIARAKAEAEAAKQRAEAAKAEAEAAKIEIERIKAEAEAWKQKAQRDAATEIAKAKADSERRQALAKQAVRFVQRNGSVILNQAYPLAFKKLTYGNAELVGIGGSDDGYIATVRLYYRNLFRRSHYLEIALSYDPRGGYRSWKFTGYSDMIAPKELTLGSLMHLTN